LKEEDKRREDEDVKCNEGSEWEEEEGGGRGKERKPSAFDGVGLKTFGLGCVCKCVCKCVSAEFV